MLLSSNIRFEDALGRVASLQYEEFRHLPVSNPASTIGSDFES